MRLLKFFINIPAIRLKFYNVVVRVRTVTEFCLKKEKPQNELWRVDVFWHIIIIMHF